jgi:hypothetical protein
VDRPARPRPRRLQADYKSIQDTRLRTTGGEPVRGGPCPRSPAATACSLTGSSGSPSGPRGSESGRRNSHNGEHARGGQGRSGGSTAMVPPYGPRPPRREPPTSSPDAQRHESAMPSRSVRRTLVDTSKTCIGKIRHAFSLAIATTAACDSAAADKMSSVETTPTSPTTFASPRNDYCSVS